MRLSSSRSRSLGENSHAGVLGDNHVGALSRLSISRPASLKPYSGLNGGQNYPDRVKPFSVLLASHIRPFGHPVGVEATGWKRVARYEADPTKWQQLSWIDWYSGTRHHVGRTAERDYPEMMRLQIYRDVVREFRAHSAAKSARADDAACGRQTVRLLQWRLVQET